MWQHAATAYNVAKGGYDLYKTHQKVRHHKAIADKHARKAKRAPYRAKKLRAIRALQSISQHNDLSSDRLYMKIGHKAVKKHVKASEIYHQKSQVFANTAGQQAVTLIGQYQLRSHLLKSTITSPAATAAGCATDDWPTGPFALNPYEKTTGSTLMNAVMPIMDRCHVHKLSGQMAITNFSNIASEVEILFVLSKKTPNAVQNVKDTWLTAVAEEIVTLAGVPNPIQRVSATTSPQSGVDNISLIGARPYKFKMFKDFWKVIGSKKFTLQGGDTKKIALTIDINKILDRSTVNNAEDIIAGWTINALCIHYGGPVIEAAGGVDTGISTYGSAKLSVLTNFRITFSYPPPQASSRVPTTVGDYNFAATTFANQKLVNDVDAVVPMDAA